MLHTFYRSVVQIQVRYFHPLQNDTLVLYSISVVLRCDVGALGIPCRYTPWLPPRCPYLSLYVLPPEMRARGPGGPCICRTSALHWSLISVVSLPRWPLLLPPDLRGRWSGICRPGFPAISLGRRCSVRIHRKVCSFSRCRQRQDVGLYTEVQHSDAAYGFSSESQQLALQLILSLLYADLLHPVASELRLCCTAPGSFR